MKKVCRRGGVSWGRVLGGGDGRKGRRDMPDGTAGQAATASACGGGRPAFAGGLRRYGAFANRPVPCPCALSPSFAADVVLSAMSDGSAAMPPSRPFALNGAGVARRHRVPRRQAAGDAV